MKTSVEMCYKDIKEELWRTKSDVSYLHHLTLRKCIKINKDDNYVGNPKETKKKEREGKYA